MRGITTIRPCRRDQREAREVVLHVPPMLHVSAVGRQILQRSPSSRAHPEVKTLRSLLRICHRCSHTPVRRDARGPDGRSQSLLVVDLVHRRAHARLAFCRACRSA
eukprot:768367-Hanusia_phi.AAC.3